MGEGMTPEPKVPPKGGVLGCPSCGYGCACCCHCDCQTPCPEPDDDGDCLDHDCHGGHEPWECLNWSTRYRWAKWKAATQ